MSGKVKYKIKNLSDRSIVLVGHKNTMTIPGRKECPEQVYELSEAAAKRIIPRLRRYHNLQITKVEAAVQAAETQKTAPKAEKATAQTQTKTAEKVTEKTVAKESK